MNAMVKGVATGEAARSCSGMSSQAQAEEVNPLFNAVLWILVLCLAVVQVFITFRGLNSQQAMDQAQIAREMARGHGFSTLMVRPAQVQQMQANGREINLSRVADTFHPPLQPALWAAVFSLAKSWWAFDPTSAVYRLDRVIACLGAVCLLLTLLLVHGLARRLFDRTLANFTVLTLALSKPLWDVALCAGSRGLLMLLFTLAAYWLFMLMRRAANDEPAGLLPLGLGLVCAAMLMTHWMAAWLVLGLVIAVAWLLPENRGTLVMVVLLPLLALGAWGWRNWQISGDPVGMTKMLLTNVISPLSDAQQMRDLDNTSPPVRMAALLRKVNLNITDQARHLLDHVLMVLPAVLALLAGLHRFRKPEVGALRWAMGILWAMAVIGMALVGLQRDATDDFQIHAALVPVLCAFGFAGVAVIWARFRPGSGGVWTQQGHAVLLVGFTLWTGAMSLYGDLTTGLAFRGRMLQWPPYRPDTTAMLTKMVKADETLASDAPWAMAWYADRTCVWLPKNREQFANLKEMAAAQQRPIVGMVITPQATMDDTFTSQFSGPYADWMEVIVRGPTLSLGYDLAAHVPWLREYPKLLPLGGMQMPDGRQVPVLTFYADRERW